MSPGNDRGSILTFAVIALLILGMAVVNFTNLATARASQRAREVALRKVLGANRRQLIVQFIGESVLISLLAMVIALALVELLMPAFSNFLDADMKVAYFGGDGSVLGNSGLPSPSSEWPPAAGRSLPTLSSSVTTCAHRHPDSRPRSLWQRGLAVLREAASYVAWRLHIPA